MFVPLIVGLSYAFQDIQILNPFATGWVGLAHFEALLGDRIFYRALGNTLWWTGGSRHPPVRPRPRPGAAAEPPVRRPPPGPGGGVPALGGADLPVRPDLGLAVQSGDRAAAALAGGARAFCAEPYNILGDPAHRHVGADRRQRLVRRAVLRDHAARRPAGDPALALRGGGDRRGLRLAGVHQGDPAVPRADHRDHGAAAHDLDLQLRRPDRRDDQWRARQRDPDPAELHLHDRVQEAGFRLRLGDRDGAAGAAAALRR